MKSGSWASFREAGALGPEEPEEDPRPNIYIRRLSDRSIVETIPMPVNVNERSLEMAVSGLVQKIRADEFFVDTSEVDEALR